METIDRLHRDVLAECIRQFFEGTLNPEEAIHPLSLLQASGDKTVQYVLDQWDFFLEDEYGGSVLRFSKESWDAWQRYLLLLESDRHIYCETKLHWSRWQWVAAGATIFFVGCGLIFGILNAALWIGIPLSVLSVLISRATKLKVPPYIPIVCPFESFQSLSRTYDEVKTFRKMRHPKPPRSIQLPLFVTKAIKTKLLIFWVFIFPTIVFLPLQILPRIEPTTRVE